MSYRSENPNNYTQANQLVIGAYEYLDPNAILAVRYGNILYRTIFQDNIKTDIPRGANEYSNEVHDFRGVGNFVGSGGSSDANQIQFSTEKYTKRIFQAAVSTSISLEEVWNSEMAESKGLMTAISRLTSRTKAMQAAALLHIERSNMFGDAKLGYDGYINRSEVSQTTAAVGAAAGTEWSTKTPDEIIFDVVSAISTIYEQTRTVNTPDTVLLPPNQAILIWGIKGGTRANDETLLNYLKKLGIPYAKEVMDLDIRPMRYLEGAGVGSTDRMIVATLKDTSTNALDYVENSDERSMYFLEPLPPLNLRSPIETLTASQIAGFYRFGEMWLPYPSTMTYVDGI